MKRYLPLLLCMTLAGCLRSFFWPAQPTEEDLSIVFPSFFDRAPVLANEPSTLYQFDGVVLKAISIAANDFLPREDEDTPCADRREAHTYRVLRRDDVIFIRIDENPAHCGRKHGALDSGAKYAIHVDGRILRRIVDGMEPYTGPTGPPVPGEPGVSPSFDPQHRQSPPFMPGPAHDGGTSPGPDGGPSAPP